MKHIFTTLAAAAVALSANAALNWDYTTAPKAGVVDQLNDIVITFDNIFEIEINHADEIELLHDGVPMDRIARLEGSNAIAIVPDGISGSGMYTVVIPAGALCGYSEDYVESGDNPEEIVVGFELAGMAGGGFDWSCTSEPAEGVVTELSKITVEFPNLADVDINSVDDVLFSVNGTPVEGVSVKDGANNEPNVELSFAEPLTAPGVYTLEFPPYVLCAFDEEYNYEDNPEAITLTWEIEKTVVPGALDFTYTASLPENEPLAYFGELTLTFPNLASVDCTAAGVTVLKNDEPVAGVTAAAEANTLKITLAEAIANEQAEVKVVIAAEALTATDAQGAAGKNTEPISIAYTIETPVQNDLTLAIGTPKPNADGQISAEKQLSTIIFVSENANLRFDETGTEPNVTIKEVNGDFTASARLKKAFGFNQNYTYFSADFGSAPTYNGEYEIIVSKGAFGDEAWFADHNYGHSNDEIRLTFELIDGLGHETPVVKPAEVLPADGNFTNGADIATVTIKFAEAMEIVDNAVATLAGTDVIYAEETAIQAEGDGFTAKFATVPTEKGTYVFSVPTGAFKNAEGVLSAEITCLYSLSISDGVAAIEAEEVRSVYNMQGIRLGTDVKALPAGIYVINGRKVVVK